MNQKKCPKCGEINPPEAVMCWACYTPLAGSGGSADKGPPSPARAPAQASEKEKKAFAPWQLGAGGVVLFAVLGFAAKTMFGGSPPDDADSNTVTAPTRVARAVTQAVSTTSAAAPAPPVIAASAPAGATVAVAPQRAGFTIVSAPNPRYNWGTMAIVPTDQGTDSTGAASLAGYARQQMMRNKKWLILHIYVFADRQSGLTFRRYQSRRRGAPLESEDYQALTDIWPSTLVRYEYNRGAEGILIPKDSPDNWWGKKAIYMKAQ